MRRLNAPSFPVASRGMQIISLGAAVSGTASPPDFHLVVARLTEFMHRDDTRWLLHFYLALLIAGPILNIIWSWIASKVVVGGEGASIRNALKYWLASLLLAGAIFVGLIFAGPLIAIKMGAAAIIAVIGGACLLSLLLSVLIPMKIYEIGFFRALGFIVLTVVISGLGNGVFGFAMAKTFGIEARIAAVANAVGKTEAERQAFAGRLFGKDAADEIDRMLDDAAQPIGNPKTLAEREAAIQAIQQKLDARRRALPPGNREALAAFQLRLDRYMRLLNQVKTDRAAQLATPNKP